MTMTLSLGYRACRAGGSVGNLNLMTFLCLDMRVTSNLDAVTRTGTDSSSHIFSLGSVDNDKFVRAGTSKTKVNCEAKNGSILLATRRKASTQRSKDNTNSWVSFLLCNNRGCCALKRMDRRNTIHIQ